MPKGWKGWAIWAAAQVVLTLALKLIWKLVENAVIGWGDDQIAAVLGITSPALSTVIAWGIPFGLAGVTLWLYHLFVQRTGTVAAVPPSVAPKARRGRMVIAGYILLVVSTVGVAAALIMISRGPSQEARNGERTLDQPTAETPRRSATVPHWELTPGDLMWRHDKAKELLDAAKEAYSETRKSFAATIAEGNNATPDQIILWYCYALINLSEVWGVRPPSSKWEPLDLHGYELKYNTRTVSAPIPGNSIYFIQLYISRDDLKKSIEKIAAMATKPSWAPEHLVIAALSSPPPAPPRKEKVLLGSARIRFTSALGDAHVLYATKGIREAAVEKDKSLLALSQSNFICKFYFRDSTGPYDISAYPDGQYLIQPNISSSVTHNDDSFVKMEMNLMFAFLNTFDPIEVQINFYKKDEK